ncbi:hypothetical protein [Tessaracoccus massiliensis]|uniref:hypothetical protein n=1 Tax=Tessaracoccus massiliensis TaxID=1522311 RepID=UPI00058B0A9A|nr:hypothetical protein [Tessaracoccus massiliensis]
MGGLYLLTRDGGPMLLPQLALWPFLGVTLLFLAFTLGARVLASIFFRDAGCAEPSEYPAIRLSTDLVMTVSQTVRAAAGATRGPVPVHPLRWHTRPGDRP